MQSPNPSPLPIPNVQQMGAAIGGRVFYAACALVATRAYNDANRHKLLPDAWKLIKDCDDLGLKIAVEMVSANMKEAAAAAPTVMPAPEPSKIITP